MSGLTQTPWWTLVAGLTAVALTANPLDAQASDGPDLSDAEVAHVAVTANSIDVEMGKLAKSRSSHPQVVGFAETMISDHTAVNKQAAALAEKLGVTPQPNDVSRSLREGAEKARDRLAKLEGQAFNVAYIDREVEYHRAVIDALDNVLVPTTENAELKGLLEKVRPALVAHLERAKDIQKSLRSTR